MPDGPRRVKWALGVRGGSGLGWRHCARSSRLEPRHFQHEGREGVVYCDTADTRHGLSSTRTQDGSDRAQTEDCRGDCSRLSFRCEPRRSRQCLNPPMFESIVVRNLKADENTFDAGLLAETLLFYQNVHIALDRSTLPDIISGIGADCINYLVDEEHISLSFERNLLGISTVNVEGRDVHGPVQFSSHSKFKIRYSKEEDIISAVSRTMGSSRNARRAARRLIDRTPLETAFDRLDGDTLPGMVRRDLEDVEFVNQAALSVVRALVPDVPFRLTCTIIPKPTLREGSWLRRIFHSMQSTQGGLQWSVGR